VKKRFSASAVYIRPEVALLDQLVLNDKKKLLKESATVSLLSKIMT